MDDLYDIYEDDAPGDDYYDIDNEDDAYGSGGDEADEYDAAEQEYADSDDEFLAEEEGQDSYYYSEHPPYFNLGPSPRTPPRTPPRAPPAAASQVEDVIQSGTSATPPSPGSAIPGRKSLVDMVLDVATSNLDNLIHKKLWYSMPSGLVLKVYLKAKRKNKLSMDAWSLLSGILYDTQDKVDSDVFHREYRLDLPPRYFASTDTTSLEMCLAPAVSLSFDFITHLIIKDTCGLNAREFLCISDMKNLGLLRISEPRSDKEYVNNSLGSAERRITDRVIRAWSEKDDPFPVLRILQFFSCTEISPKSMRYWSRFPALAIVTVRGLRKVWDCIEEGSVVHGWKIPTNPDDLQVLALRYIATCRDFDSENVRAESHTAAWAIARTNASKLSLLYGSNPVVKLRKPLPVRQWNARMPTNSTKEIVAISSIYSPWGIRTYSDNPMWWLYAALGYVLFNDEDLKARNPDIGSRYFTQRTYLLPPAPVMTVTLCPTGDPLKIGSPTMWFDSQRVREALHEEAHLVRYRFVRKEFFDDIATREPGWAPGKYEEDLKDDDGASGSKGSEESKGSKGSGSSGGSGSQAKSEGPVRRSRKRKLGDILASLAGM